MTGPGIGNRKSRIDKSDESVEFLLGAQRALRSRWNEFRSAFDRRDREAYRVALADFHRALRRWTETEERVLIPILARVGVGGRDAQRELKVEYVQVRELTRYLEEQISARAALGDLLGLMENLERRLSAHESEMRKVYYPAAAAALTSEERRALESARPAD